MNDLFLLIWLSAQSIDIVASVQLKAETPTRTGVCSRPRLTNPNSGLLANAGADKREDLLRNQL